MSDINILAYYLPQFHPTPHNDIWWGKGFTEWTNVARASKLFKNHYQPHIPADLGFYDLRVPEVREQQVEMARYAGVSAFCYYHYWFEYGKEELEGIFNEILHSGKPDFPFCLCWANESWYSKMWSMDGSVVKKNLLIEQKSPNPEDNVKHFDSLLPAFADKRYFRYEGKLVFVIYKPLLFGKEISAFIDLWRKLAQKNGVGDFYFIGYSLDIENEYEKIIELGFDAVNSCGIQNCKMTNRTNGLMEQLFIRMKFHYRSFLNRPVVFDYKDVLPSLINNRFDIKDDVLPTIVPNWDHTPRSGVNGFLFDNSTPNLFVEHLAQVKELLHSKNNKLCFLKSWNEWGEGNYVEPDLRFGWGYLDALRDFTKYMTKNQTH